MLRKGRRLELFEIIMTTFSISLYRPEERDAMATEIMKKTSDLRIDPAEYQALLLERWPGISAYSPPQYVLLEWVFPVTREGAGPIGGLEDNQTVFLDTPFDEFFLWHRSIIPAQYQLFLFHEGSWDTLALKPETSLEEIRRFIRGLS